MSASCGNTGPYRDIINAFRDMSGPCRVVTIDGPAGVGKSTLAKRLAGALGIAYLDTGAMFRTVALRLGFEGTMRAERAQGHDEQLAEQLADCVFSLEGTGVDTRLLCNGRLVGDEVRSEEAGMMAARVGGNAQVRACLKEAQQRLGRAWSLVAEGRDMGTVVFPGAFCKLFLDADPLVRAERRYRQLLEMGKPCQFDELVEQIQERDRQDRDRAVAPLRPARDAVIIDTSSRDIEAVYGGIMDALEQARLDAEPREYAMRRKDRLQGEEENLALLDKAEYGVLALADGRWPYAVPLSFALMDGALYVHCAREGRKIDVLNANNRACFTVVGPTKPVYDHGFSTYYESVMVFGKIVSVEEKEEKTRALVALARKYLPGDMDKADGDIERSFKRTAVYRIAIEQMSGKAKHAK